jgi:predicted tellurium resistance membrane protein TerC
MLGSPINIDLSRNCLGIDNIIFISIATGKLPVESRKKATKIGMFLLCS